MAERIKASMSEGRSRWTRGVRVRISEWVLRGENSFSFLFSLFFSVFLCNNYFKRLYLVQKVDKNIFISDLRLKCFLSKGKNAFKL